MANINDVARYFLHLDDANEGDGITNLKLQKLAYYAQGFYSAIHDEQLFDDEFSAWTHGPVVEALYHSYKNRGKNTIPVPSGFDPSTSPLNENQKDLIGEVFEVFGQYSAWKLRNMTHEESPWLNHESDAGVIPAAEIREYFKTRIN